MRPVIRFHSNSKILFSHTRDIQVAVFANRVQYDIPIYFEEEKGFVGEKSWVRFVLNKPQGMSLPENPVVVEIKNPRLE